MTAKFLTTEDLAEFPNDGIERWLVRGQLRMAVGRFSVPSQSKAIARISQSLGNWCDQCPKFGLEVYSRVHCRIARDPDTIVIAHVAVADPEAWVPVNGSAFELVEGFPPLLVDVVDWREDGANVMEREHVYHKTTGVVWMGDPHRKMIQVMVEGADPWMKPDLPLMECNQLHAEMIYLASSLSAERVFGPR